MTARRVTRSLAALVALAAAGACTGPREAPIIATPPLAVLERAWRGIDDAQLAAQLRPGGPFGPAACVVHMGVWREQANARQRAAIDRAARAWRGALVREGEGDEQFADQMIGSSVNPLADTPPALRQAAAAWCVAHAPDGYAGVERGT